MNMMRNKNRGGNRNNRGGGRRYNNGGGGGNRQPNDGQNLQRQKHHATQMLGKYNDLLRNAQNNGDRVDVEYYLQHIDHYNRVLADIAVIEAERYAAQRESQINTASDASGSGAEGEEGAADTAGNPQDGGQGRMHRHPRRPYHAQPQAIQATETPAAPEATTSGEIPLPGSILPPI